MAQCTEMVNYPRWSHRLVQHIKDGSKCTTSETSDFGKRTSHLGGSQIHHMRKCKRLFVNVCECMCTDFYRDGVFNRNMTVQKRRRFGGFCQTNNYNSVEQVSYMQRGNVKSLTLWRRNFLLNFSTPVFKMWILQEPKKVALWNKRHLEEKKRRMCSVFTIFSKNICWVNI